MNKITALLIISLAISGCVETTQTGGGDAPAVKERPIESVSVSPATKENQYDFIKETTGLSDQYEKLYASSGKPGEKLTVAITSPAGYQIQFKDSSTKHPIDKYTRYSLSQGVYPFSLYKKGEDNPSLTGALVAYNVNRDASYAVFGIKEGEQLFNDEIVAKAKSGVLGSYSIRFDDRDVIYYWLGDRANLYAGGKPSIEVDFSKNKNLNKLKIKGDEKKDLKGQLDLTTTTKYFCSLCGKKSSERAEFNNKCLSSPNKRHALKSVAEFSGKEFPIEMTTTNGATFQGHIEIGTPNAYTAFLSIPCQIPDELFTAAAQGTISKYTITTSDQSVELAKIVFGLKN